MPHANVIPIPRIDGFWILLNLVCWCGCGLFWWLQGMPLHDFLKRFFRFLLVLVASVAILIFACSSYFFWFHHRGQPKPETRELFEGVTYIRDIRQKPRPLVIHAVKIDLKAPGLAFLVTPPAPAEGRQLRARVTSEFLKENNLQLAVNANFFSPFYFRSIFDYAPRDGQPVDVAGVAASRGKVYSAKPQNYWTLNLTERNEAAITSGTLPWFNAVAGDRLLPIPKGSLPAESCDPRTAAGLDRERTTLILMVIDGRQPQYSEGVTLAELAELMKEYGAERAINLDGGGSTALAIRDRRGKVRVLNSPIHTGIPYRERPVANHLGIFAGANQ